jgi:hypothetical protein
VPHQVTHDLCGKRKKYTKAILPFLHDAKRDSWHHLVNDNESWFSCNTSPRRAQTLSRDDVVTKPRLDIQSKEFMFTIIWNRSGFHVIDRLSNDTKMNSDYSVTKILIQLEQAIFLQGRASHQKRLVAHLDNCSVHTSRASTD